MKKITLLILMVLTTYVSCTKDGSDDGSEEHSTSNEHWASERGNNSNTGYTDNQAPQSMPSVKWKSTSIPGEVFQPVVYKGVVYFGSATSSSLYALDMHSGNVKWNYSHGEKFIVNFSSPTIANETVFFGTSDIIWDDDSSNFLYAIDRSSGDEKWKFSTNGSVVGSPKVDKGVAYFGTTNGYIYAIDSSTGSKIWQIQADGEVLQSPALVNGTLIIGSTFNIYAIDINTGQEKWGIYTGHTFESNPAVSDGVVFIGVERYLFALDMNTGDEIWKFRKENDSWGWINSPAVANGFVYFTDSHNTLYTLDKNTGIKKWTLHKDLSDVNYSNAVVTDNYVYVGFGSREFSAVDVTTGIEHWKYDTGGDYWISGSSAISDGILFFTSDEYITALE